MLLSQKHKVQIKQCCSWAVDACKLRYGSDFQMTAYEESAYWCGWTGVCRRQRGSKLQNICMASLCCLKRTCLWQNIHIPGLGTGTWHQRQPAAGTQGARGDLCTRELHEHKALPSHPSEDLRAPAAFGGEFRQNLWASASLSAVSFDGLKEFQWSRKAPSHPLEALLTKLLLLKVSWSAFRTVRLDIQMLTMFVQFITFDRHQNLIIHKWEITYMSN